MGSISIILRRPPYGSVEASEAIRHALGGKTEDMDVKLILLDGGVHVARKGQDISGTGYLSAEDGIRDCIDMGVFVYADNLSMVNARLRTGDMVEGIIFSEGSEIADAISDSEITMIF
jgi:tRNA 2-thiouridine synthesizing protein D